VRRAHAGRRSGVIDWLQPIRKRSRKSRR
jgi:hypothetical protein